MLLAGLIPGSHPASCLKQPRLNLHRDGSALMGWVLMHQPEIKKMPPQTSSQSNVMEAVLIEVSSYQVCQDDSQDKSLHWDRTQVLGGTRKEKNTITKSLTD